MTAQDWLIIAALFAMTVALAFMGGSRRGRSDGGSAPNAPKPATLLESDKKPAESPAVAAAAADVEARPSAADEALAKVEYEEDADIDPTKVGAAARTAVPRLVYQPPVQRIVYDEDADTDEPTLTESLFLVSAMAQTDPGLRRKRNEDSVLVLESSSLFVVADGMGGYRGGELASQLAVTTVGDAFRRRTFEGEPHENVPAQASELARAMQMANSAILEIAANKPELKGMGTTVVAARFSANKKRVYIGHVGDSRCYRLRDGVLRQMTADHTMADQGVQGPAAAHLSRAVGIWPTVPIDIIIGTPVENDVYLLCSDGLTKMLDDNVIGTVLRAEDDLKSAVERLIDFANGRGGKDNISVVLVRVVPPNWRPKPSEPFTDAREAERASARPDVD